MAAGNHHLRRLKGALLLIGILVFGSVVVLFLTHRQKRQSAQTGDTAVIENRATISLTGVRHTAVEDGEKAWALKAESADYRLEENLAVFKTPRITFFGEGDDDIFLSAPSATLHTRSNDLDVTGHTVIKNKQYALQTEKLKYIHKNRICVTHAPVTVTSEVLKITADNMRYDLGRNTINFSGNVMGVINEDIGI